MKLLIVEDTPEQQQTYKDNIESYNKDNEVKIIYDMKGTYEEGLDLLHKHTYDAAILDIKLGGEDLEGKGNLIIEEIKNKLRFPIFVVSGFPEDLKPELKDQSIFFKVYDRGNVLISDLLKEIKYIYDTGLTRVLGGRGKIEEYLSTIFWEHLSKNLDVWINHNNEKSLLRYVLSHIQEYLDINEFGKFDYYYTEEFYIKPPIKGFIYTGSILKQNTGNDFYIVLSPACDLVQNKSDQILICKIEDFKIKVVNEQIRKLKLELKQGMTEEQHSNIFKQKYNAKQILKDLFKNNYSLKYHYLPKTSLFNGGFINFQLVSSFTPTVIKNNYTEVLCITNPFLKDIISRFSYYYSRQGSPDFDLEKIFEELIAENELIADF